MYFLLVVPRAFFLYHQKSAAVISHILLRLLWERFLSRPFQTRQIGILNSCLLRDHFKYILYLFCSLVFIWEHENKYCDRLYPLANIPSIQCHRFCITEFRPPLRMTLVCNTLSLVIDVLCLSTGVPACVFILFKISKVKRFYRWYPLEMNVVLLCSVACLTSLPIDIAVKLLAFFGIVVKQPLCVINEFLYKIFTNAMILTLIFVSIHRIQRVKDSLTAQRSWPFLVNVVEIITSWSMGILLALTHLIDDKHTSNINLSCHDYTSRFILNDVLDVTMFVILLGSLVVCWCLVVRYIRSFRRVQPVVSMANHHRKDSKDSKSVEIDLASTADAEIASTVTAFDGTFDETEDKHTKHSTATVLESAFDGTFDENDGIDIKQSQSTMDGIIGSTSVVDSQLGSPNSTKSRSSSRKTYLTYYPRCNSESSREKINMKVSQATSSVSDSVLMNPMSLQEKRRSFRMSRSKSSKYLCTQETTARIGSVKRVLRKSMSFTEKTENASSCFHRNSKSVDDQKNADIRNQRKISCEGQFNKEHTDTKYERVTDEMRWTGSESALSVQGSIEFRLFEKQSYRETLRMTTMTGAYDRCPLMKLTRTKDEHRFLITWSTSGKIVVRIRGEDRSLARGH